ncbi:MAG: bifunctional 5,10-methylenetetrahydrofolate dehydrogenase/5,10-methenyltetrahydrofolate cyclohydrolase [Oscillospiraceae bacterium]|jgi:methylenetetrahydrofolate dehydrogenase (NADP+)/methenyltetrahydrofolate cyclohydrolase|nr:bifunctional 5,10-methylenetetrahydrofolate dehydrogenase/5,10-methenyltetrahydrofolate cyclohydrolase [Oscillospiraceae bacterium]
MATRLDGKALSEKLKKRCALESAALREAGTEPCLAVVLVGSDPASAVYVKNKKKDCEESGIRGESYEMPDTAEPKELFALIDKLNGRGDVHGILVQFPLPAQFDARAVLMAIDPKKDVDCFHPENVGLMTQGAPRFLPCTPAGVMALLDEYGIDPLGKECVVVGRSDIVGKPMAMLLLRRHATVTVAHSRTPDLARVCRRADILVSAAGKLGLITRDMVKQGAVVVDVAMNRTADGKLKGDALFDDIEPLCSYITPVPGGVGPMTRAILMQNTLTAAHGGKL